MRLSRRALRALASNELIGLEAEVVKSADTGLMGLRGTITDETKNTVELETVDKTVTLDKRGITLRIRFPEGEEDIEGREMLQRPEERLKKLWTKVK